LSFINNEMWQKLNSSHKVQKCPSNCIW
jgi:hypothetical protein